ncbi:MAG: glycosyltransferase family 2 protein [Clostridia bacterium]|nr:glycosyltransferase family 2 protein [Clostridia bacterium]
MPDFKYRVSIIVPVYNAEEYIRSCINSLLAQTIDFSQMQILLINDGSKDSSEEICKEYAEKYSNVFLYTKENEGASQARNFGIKKAEGKYIFYLDSDDSVKPETVKSVCDFFDSVYDEVDLVTYKIIQYYQGKPSIVHYRYMTLNKTGVYDLNLPQNRFITQTHMNICVKNLKENNVFFDTIKHEDEKYCCQILRDKMKIGYCAKGEYIYNRNNINSVVSTQFSPELIFGTSMKLYEDLFVPYPGKVPPYFQGIVFNDFRWKLMDGKFLPKHLEGEEWIKANRRIDALLRRMDADTIILHPSLSVTDMHYWLKRRGGCTVINNPSEVLVCCEGKVIFTESKFKASKNGNEITIKSPVFNHLKKNQVAFKVNGKPAEFSFAVDYTDKNTCEPKSFYPSLFVADENARITVLINSIEYDVK